MRVKDSPCRLRVEAFIVAAISSDRQMRMIGGLSHVFPSNLIVGMGCLAFSLLAKRIEDREYYLMSRKRRSDHSKTIGTGMKAKQTDKKNKPQPTGTDKESKTGIGQAILLMVASLVLFFGLLEGGLALFGVKPVIRMEDPFVGFASNVPLYIPTKNRKGILHTAPNKTNKFNKQTFSLKKPHNTYRIFCVGGSTTYGRPYDDQTSFSRWIRDILPETDSTKNWEVINAGGISYASYRVAHLMEELIEYQPDLFIIYTGQNEFLEERTYRKVREIPPFVRSTVSLLAHTRTWTAMKKILKPDSSAKKTEKDDRDILAVDVKTKLNQSIGPQNYTRNDVLKEQILDHYRLSMERMAALAKSVDAKVIFVTPGSNLKDCSPFKSEHGGSLDASVTKRAEKLLADARIEIKKTNWELASKLLEEGASLDPRCADLQYYRGKALFALRQFKDAKDAFRRARDEDVCPLRALTPMREIVSKVAKEHGDGLVDITGLIEKLMMEKYGHSIPGKEFFLDHVHPTVEGHKLLGVAIIEEMMEEGLVESSADWKSKIVPTVAARIDSGIDRNVHAEALANLARVLLWAGKNEDAARLAEQALNTAEESPQVTLNATGTLASFYQEQGFLEKARRNLVSGIEVVPDAVSLRLKLGKLLANRPYFRLDKAAAHLLWVCRQSPDNDLARQLYGQVMAWRGRPRIAFASLKKAVGLNPQNQHARDLMARLRPMLIDSDRVLKPHKIKVDAYPGVGPKQLAQVIPGEGPGIPDGIVVEFFKNGRVKRLMDYKQGQKMGVDMAWDKNGQVLTRIVNEMGSPVDLEKEKRTLYKSIENKPANIDYRLELGKLLMDSPFLQLAKASGHLLFVCQQSPENDEVYELLGQVMAQRGRLRNAYPLLVNALRLNPDNQKARQMLAQVDPMLEKRSKNPVPPQFETKLFPSGAPKEIVQLFNDEPNGISVEFHKNGRLRHLVEYKKGELNGFDMVWASNGKLRSLVVHDTSL